MTPGGTVAHIHPPQVWDRFPEGWFVLRIDCGLQRMSRTGDYECAGGEVWWFVLSSAGIEVGGKDSPSRKEAGKTGRETQERGGWRPQESRCRARRILAGGLSAQVQDRGRAGSSSPSSSLSSLLLRDEGRWRPGEGG